MNPSVPDAASRVLPPAGVARRRAPGPVTAYDFRRPSKLSRESIRPLQVALETFAGQAAIALTSALRSVTSVELVEIEQRSYAEYVDSLGELTYMMLFTAEPIEQTGVLELPIAVVMTCLDRLLGGPGAQEQPMRPLSDLESAVMGEFLERFVQDLHYAFAPIVAVDPKLVGVEYSPQIAQIAQPSDTVVVARYALQRGEERHTFSLCLAYSAIAPHLIVNEQPEISERERAERVQSSARLAAGLQDIPVDVSIRFRGTPVEPMTLTGLQVGDVVALRHPAAAPLDVVAADLVFAHATAGSQGPRLAALVVASTNQEIRR